MATARYLLDTHAFMWLLAEPERISDGLRRTLADPARIVLLSVASLWEIAIKQRIGKLWMADDLDSYVQEQLGLRDIVAVPIEPAHALRVAALPDLHRDPFDRLIVAQAQILNVPIVTADPRIQQYEVATINARTGETRATAS